MGLVDLASRNSFWKGLDYFDRNKVLSNKNVGNNIFQGKVAGTEIYNVIINLEHPKKSKCSCPFANGNSKICKHMVALYFYNFPKEGKKILKEEEERERRVEKFIEKREREQYKRISEYVNSLTDEQIKTELIGALMQIEDMNEGYYDYEDYYERYDDYYEDEY